MALVLTALTASSPTGATQVLAAATAVLPVNGGNFYITYAGVCAMTLAVPVADGFTLRIVSLTANAHTITTPASGLNGVSHIATFGATIANALTLKSFGGQWIIALDEETGITLS
jgi:hypothetical protein